MQGSMMTALALPYTPPLERVLRYSPFAVELPGDGDEMNPLLYRTHSYCYDRPPFGKTTDALIATIQVNTAPDSVWEDKDAVELWESFATTICFRSRAGFRAAYSLARAIKNGVHAVECQPGFAEIYAEWSEHHFPVLFLEPKNRRAA
jgi:hypothetical protein